MSGHSGRRYFLAVFGEPDAPKRDCVESGQYHYNGSAKRLDHMCPGDCVLLYCTKKYTEYSMSVPGIGKVQLVDAQARTFDYEFVPFTARLPYGDLMSAFTKLDQKSLKCIGLSNFWVFPISEASYNAALSAANTPQGPANT